MGTKRYESPKLELLNEVMEEATQCKTFGMPKRSCKTLSSGLHRRRTEIKNVDKFESSDEEKA